MAVTLNCAYTNGTHYYMHGRFAHRSAAFSHVYCLVLIVTWAFQIGKPMMCKTVPCLKCIKSFSTNEFSEFSVGSVMVQNLGGI